MAWATYTEADTYLSAGIEGAAWAALTDPVKTQYLESAYRQLVNDPDYSWPGTTTTNQTNGNIELANFILSNPEYFTQLTSGVSSFTIGTFSETKKSNAEMFQQSKYPIQVSNLIDEYEASLPAVGRITRKTRTDGKC
jgi:hypothetical protein